MKDLIIITYIKKITLYDNIIKLKPYLFSHLVVMSLYLCEFSIFIFTIYETVIEQLDLNNGIIPDYVLGFNTYLLLNQLIGFILLGFFEIIHFFIFFIYKFLFKKIFLFKNKFLTNNFIYHIFWTFGVYITIIIFIFTVLYLISISREGFVWLLNR